MHIHDKNPFKPTWSSLIIASCSLFCFCWFVFLRKNFVKWNLHNCFLTTLCLPAAKDPAQSVLSLHSLWSLLWLPHRCLHHHGMPTHMWVMKDVCYDNYLAPQAASPLKLSNVLLKLCLSLRQFVKAASWSTFSTATDALRAALWSMRHNPFTISGMACKFLLAFWSTSSSLFVLCRDSWQPHRQVNSYKSRKIRYTLNAVKTRHGGTN